MNPDSKSKIIMKRLLIFVPVIIAVAVVTVMVRNQKEPRKKAAAEVPRQVRTIRLAPVEVVPRAIGYGYAEPGQVWQVVPEVSGKIVEVSPGFKKGNFVRKGEVLVRIDPTDYELTVNRMAINIESLDAQLDELARKENNYRASLKIQKTLLNLKQKELARNQQAMETNSISSSALDQSVMNYQIQLAQVQEIENSMALIPASRKALEADLKYGSVQLKEARVNLTRTEITAPFDCRITETTAEAGQYIRQGSAIASADGIARAEINARISLEAMRRVVGASGKPQITSTAKTMDRIKMDAVKKHLGLTARVRLVNNLTKAVWDADFTRTDASLDAQTRTVGIIVAVDDPYGIVIFGQRPPLVRNMFCEVTISGCPLTAQIVVPRSALHDGRIYVVDGENRLRRREVSVAFTQSDFAVIRDGLAAGEQVVVSDVMPAVEGMLLAAQEDEELSRRLTAQAGGLTSIQ